MKPDLRKKQISGILLTLGVFAVEFLITAAYLYPKARRGELFSARRASTDLPALFLQSLIPFLFPAALLVLFALLLKKDFAPKLYLTLHGTWQRVTALVLCTAILGITCYCLIVKADSAAVLFSLLYYLVFIAFAEEFVCRDVCPYFLRNFSWPVRYLIPNICFAILHVFAYANWDKIGGAYLFRFVSSNLLGLAVGGCLLQLLKEKSGTIWLPVLLHA
ncbi:CPBP family intramembrane glutamic endopeptidase [Pseudoramibacter faecis]|uniref:CPBP family intramembrane glutamic endopeptidase n=1 Tax=Pseudoramibacter faecis TaxID=3108534 RepID=UPI002E778542|nr:CPBP family intramembrane glutamic endopeptidase [Pseudoramibacter sp. HA2172]